MPDDGQQNMDDSALKSVVSIIKDMELKGFAVPERISIKVPWYGHEILGQFYHIYLSLIWRIWFNLILEQIYFFSVTYNKQIEECTES